MEGHLWLKGKGKEEVKNVLVSEDKIFDRIVVFLWSSYEFPLIPFFDGTVFVSLRFYVFRRIVQN